MMIKTNVLTLCQTATRLQLQLITKTANQSTQHTYFNNRGFAGTTSCKNYTSCIKQNWKCECYPL